MNDYVTVLDLINMLKKCNPEDKVKIHQYRGGYDDFVSKIKIEKIIDRDGDDNYVVIY